MPSDREFKPIDPAIAAMDTSKMCAIQALEGAKWRWVRAEAANELSIQAMEVAAASARAARQVDNANRRAYLVAEKDVEKAKGWVRNTTESLKDLIEKAAESS